MSDYMVTVFWGVYQILRVVLMHDSFTMNLTELEGSYFLTKLISNLMTETKFKNRICTCLFDPYLTGSSSTLR